MVGWEEGIGRQFGRQGQETQHVGGCRSGEHGVVGCMSASEVVCGSEPKCPETEGERRLGWVELIVAKIHA